MVTALLEIPGIPHPSRRIGAVTKLQAIATPWLAATISKRTASRPCSRNRRPRGPRPEMKRRRRSRRIDRSRTAWVRGPRRTRSARCFRGRWFGPGMGPRGTVAARPRRFAESKKGTPGRDVGRKLPSEIGWAGTTSGLGGGAAWGQRNLAPPIGPHQRADERAEDGAGCGYSGPDEHGRGGAVEELTLPRHHRPRDDPGT